MHRQNQQQPPPASPGLAISNGRTVLVSGATAILCLLVACLGAAVFAGNTGGDLARWWLRAPAALADPECRAQQRQLLAAVERLAADATSTAGSLGNQLDAVRGALSELRLQLERFDGQMTGLSRQVHEVTAMAKQPSPPSTRPEAGAAKPAGRQPIKPAPQPASPSTDASPSKQPPATAALPSKQPPAKAASPSKQPPATAASPSKQPPATAASPSKQPPAAAASPAKQTPATAASPSKHSPPPAADASRTKPPPPPQQVVKPGSGGDGFRVLSEADVKQAERDSQPLLRAGTRPDRTSTVLYGIRPKKIFQDGRRIPPVKLERILPAPGSSVEVYLFDELLSDAESDGLAAAHFKTLDAAAAKQPIVCFQGEADMLRLLGQRPGVRRPLSAADFTPGTRCLNASLSLKASSWLAFNWTRATVFYPGESRFAPQLAQRFLKAMGLPESHAGRLEVTSNPAGQGHPDREVACHLGVFATVRVFLDTVSRGGEFHLPRLGIWLRPRKSRALLVTGMSPGGDCEPAAAFNSTQVESGRRVTLTQYYHYETFPGIGTRPTEPPLPPRVAGTPVVYCDSTAPPCRWTDEWIDEHLIATPGRQ